MCHISLGYLVLVRAGTRSIPAVVAGAINMEPSVPFLREPHAALRRGVPSAKADAKAASHAVQFHLKENDARERATRDDLLSGVYGLAFPLKQQIESQILSSCQRLPGLPSSNLGAEAMSGRLDTVDFEDALRQNMDEREETAPGMHAIMEARLGMSKLPAPTREMP